MNTVARATLALTISAAVTLSGCATMDSATQKVGSVFGSKSDTTRSVTGGAILGCGAGALLGKVLGNGSDMLKGCAAGAVVGAGASVAVHRHELEAARKLAADAKQTAGVNAVVTTKTIEAKDEKGEVKPTEVLEAMTLPLPLAKVRAHAADVGRVIDKTANFADASETPETITVRGPAKERAWIDARLRASLKAGSTVKVVDEAADETELVISPVPTVRGAK